MGTPHQEYFQILMCTTKIYLHLHYLCKYNKQNTILKAAKNFQLSTLICCDCLNQAHSNIEGFVYDTNTGMYRIHLRLLARIAMLMAAQVIFHQYKLCLWAVMRVSKWLATTQQKSTNDPLPVQVMLTEPIE